MNYRTLIATAFAGAALLTTPAWAQDMPAEEGAAPAAEAGAPVAENGAPSAVSTLAPMLDDKGEQIALAAQNAPVSVQPEPAQTAEDAVKADLEAKGLRVGYNAKQDVMVGMGVAYLECANPAEDPDFIAKRDVKAIEAYLIARAAVGRAIAQTFTASARSEVVPSDDPSPLAKAMQAKKQEVEAKKAELAKKLAELDAAEAEALRGCSLMDRMDAFLDSIIKKLDASYDPAVVSQEKMDRYNAVKAEVETLKAEYKELGEAVEAAFPKKKATSEIDSEVLASMRFFGCVVQAQSEAWNKEDKTYEVAMAVIWSRKLHKMALAGLGGDASVRGKPGNRTFEQWLDAQNFASMVGSRSFTDNEGHKFFIGIGAAKVPEKAVYRREQRALAQENARVAAMFAMLGEGESQRQAKRAMTEMTDGSSYATSKLAESIAMSIKAQRVEGMDERDVFTLVNPISGQKIYVAVMAINPALAALSDDMQAVSAAGAVQNERENQIRTGKAIGREAAVEAAKKDKNALRQGMQQGVAGVAEKLPQKPTMQRNGNPNGTAPQPKAPATTAQPKSGVFTGDSDMDMDF